MSKMTMDDARRIAEGLHGDGWVDDERHYDGDMLTDLTAAILEYFTSEEASR